MEELVCIDVSWNKLRNVRLTFSQLTRFEYLNFSHNSLESIAVDGEQENEAMLKRYRFYRRISWIRPPDKLFRLRHFLAGDNALTKVPWFLEYCSEMEVFDLQSNKITCFDKRMPKKLPKLISYFMDDNPCWEQK